MVTREDAGWLFLHDGMPDHPKIENLSDRAFRALVELWCYCRRHRTDGVVTEAAWLKRTTTKVRRELLDAKLVDELPDGIAMESRRKDVVMHDYLDWQRSAADAEQFSSKKAAAGSLGNHRRWHVDQGKRSADCKFCVDSDPGPGSQSSSQMRSHVGSHVGSQTGRIDIAEKRREEKKNPTTHSESAPHVTERARTRTAPPPLETDDGRPDPARTAEMLVNAAVPRSVPREERGRLTRHVTAALGDGTPGTACTTAIYRWLARPDLGASVLPGLIGDVVRESLRDTTAPADGPHGVEAASLIAETVPTEQPSTVRIQLADHARRMLTDGTPAAAVAAGLRLWVATPGARPGHLPGLVSDALRERDRGPALSTADQRFAAAQALKNTPAGPSLFDRSLRAITGGAS